MWYRREKTGKGKVIISPESNSRLQFQSYIFASSKRFPPPDARPWWWWVAPWVAQFHAIASAVCRPSFLCRRFPASPPRRESAWSLPRGSAPNRGVPTAAYESRRCGTWPRRPKETGCRGAVWINQLERIRGIYTIGAHGLIWEKKGKEEEEEKKRKKKRKRRKRKRKKERKKRKTYKGVTQTFVCTQATSVPRLPDLLVMS